MVICFFVRPNKHSDFFTENCYDYLKMWSEQLKHVEHFQWVLLTNELKWENIEKSMHFLTENGHWDMPGDCSSQFFEQYIYIKEFITGEKIEEWATKKVPVDKRWTECFQYMLKKEAPFQCISALVEYALSLAGTSAPVERIFSTINKIWTVEKTRLHVNTLKSILFVKHNLDFSCIEFFSYLKDHKELLRQISNQQKYMNTPSTSQPIEDSNEIE